MTSVKLPEAGTVVYREKYSWSLSGFESKGEAEEILKAELDDFYAFHGDLFTVTSYVQKNTYNSWTAGYEAVYND